MENIKWISAMSDRLRDELSKEYDDETKDLIVRAFMRGLYQDPAIVEELKSSSLIESDYFEDDDEEIN
jgi:hypothetical protein